MAWCLVKYHLQLWIYFYSINVSLICRTWYNQTSLHENMINRERTEKYSEFEGNTEWESRLFVDTRVAIK